MDTRTALRLSARLASACFTKTRALREQVSLWYRLQGVRVCGALETGGAGACDLPCANELISDIQDCSGTCAMSLADTCAITPASSAGFKIQRQGRLQASKPPTTKAPKTIGIG